MCGIVGMIDLRGFGRADAARVRAMGAAIRHRGPDGDGYYDSPDHQIAFGMRRLSIIDVAGSDQPLYNEDRAIALVFNGEIYNYRELRADLLAQGHRFNTDGDGETLIHLYEQHGLGMFAHLRGMYAFALWDAARARLVLAVDHIGMKPLYLHDTDGMLYFASEVKALLADAHIPSGLNADALDTFMSFGYMIGSDTLFAGIRRLPAGHALVAERGATRLERFWSFGSGAQPIPAAEAAERAHDLISESVRLHLRSDVPLGLFLSGGVDSAAVLARMTGEAQGRVKTFTVGYAARTPDNELLAARRIAAHFGADHHERVISADDWWDAFAGYIYHHDEPNANPSAVSLYLLAQDTARAVKVVLTGLGGDELFCGYGNHRAVTAALNAQRSWGRWLAPLDGVIRLIEPYYPALKRYRVIGALPTYLPRWRAALLPPEEGLLRIQSFDGLSFSDSLRHRLYTPRLRQIWHTAQHKERAFAAIYADSRRAEPLHTAQALVINTWLAGNALLNCDKVTMAHSLEARVPFFDPHLLSFAAGLPADMQMHANKYVLRAAMSADLPAFALERPKQPFGTPIHAWFAGELAGRIQERLREPTAFIYDWFDRRTAATLLDDHFSGRAPQVEVVFRLLTLEMWARRFLSADQPVAASAAVSP